MSSRWYTYAVHSRLNNNCTVPTFMACDKGLITVVRDSQAGDTRLPLMFSVVSTKSVLRYEIRYHHTRVIIEHSIKELCFSTRGRYTLPGCIVSIKGTAYACCHLQSIPAACPRIPPPPPLYIHCHKDTNEGSHTKMQWLSWVSSARSNSRSTRSVLRGYCAVDSRMRRLRGG